MRRSFTFLLSMAPWALWPLVLYGWTEAARTQAGAWLAFTFAWAVVMLGGRALVARRAHRRPATELHAHTRDLLASRLGVSIVESPEAIYRTIASTDVLDGEWVGGFVQPGLIVSAASATRLTLSGARGSGIDEYGASQLTVVKRDGPRVEMSKQYDGAGGAGFHYVGSLSGGTLAGFWYSPLRPAFCGVFWLARADRLTPESRRAFEARVRSWSWRRTVAKCFFAAVFVTVLAAALAGDRTTLFGALGLYMAALAVYRLRAQALSFEVARVRGAMQRA